MDSSSYARAFRAACESALMAISPMRNGQEGRSELRRGSRRDPCAEVNRGARSGPFTYENRIGMVGSGRGIRAAGCLDFSGLNWRCKGRFYL